MRVLIAMDSFKGTFASLEVANIVEKGLKKVYENAIADKVLIADGGEGTVDAVVNALNGKYFFVDVLDPLGKKVRAKYGIVNGMTAIIEMAEASGLILMSEEDLNPLVASSYGTGQLILDALNRGCNKIIMGIGGSATNDGGAGMATALGAKLIDSDGNEVASGGGALDQLDYIDISGLDPRIKEVEFIVACDVDNILCGEKGASRVFGPQKGANEEKIRILDQNLNYYAQLIKRDLGMDVGEIPGAGAAGGLGAGLMAFCNANLSKGIDVLLDIVKIDESIEAADIVITGEGRIDKQTAYGKVPVGIAKRAKKFNKPVFAIAGFVDKGAELVYQHGIDAIISSVVAPMTLKAVIEDSPRLIEEASERLFRIIKAIKSM
ncbi:glycerate kinase [Fusibacter sp. 3D3]|uniref:glycerate kinase family protein n=1 Tax=Fusibacter sp. 3D3 TaxID=1048380 RepID=UPI0008539C85|nr:glycerate kinase [Fusibacter sp. 3D3]GAU75924.1 glycerate kinase [Fusibacter sp. 3D3]